MTGMKLTIKRIDGLDELLKKLNVRLIARPTRDFMTRSGIEARKQIRKLAPRNTGAGAKSIDYKVDGSTVPKWVNVETDLDYMAIQNNGTRPFYPPIRPIAAWASSKGMTLGQAYGVQHAIAKRGIRKKEFFQKGFAASRPAIQKLSGQLARDIERRASSGG